MDIWVRRRLLLSTYRKKLVRSIIIVLSRTGNSDIQALNVRNLDTLD